MFCDLPGGDVTAFRIGFFGRLGGLGGQSPPLVMGSLPVEVALSLLYLLVGPALGAAECRPAAVHSLSPACIRHPGRAGTDPDTCHQRSTGMCPRDAGLGEGTGRSWLLAAEEGSAIAPLPPHPSAGAASTLCTSVHPKGQMGFIGGLDSKRVSYHLVLEGQRNAKEGKSQGHLKKAWCMCVRV